MQDPSRTEIEQFQGKTVLFICQRVKSPSGAGEKEVCSQSCEGSIRAYFLPCSGRVDPLHMLTAIENGAERVAVVGCPQGQCRYGQGNNRAKKRVSYVQALLGQIGLDPDIIVWAEGPPGHEGSAESLARGLGILSP